MSNPDIAAAIAKAKKIAANLTASAPEAGTKRSMDSDEEGSPATKRFSGSGDSSTSNAKLAAAAAAAAKLNQKLGGSGGAASTVLGDGRSSSNSKSDNSSFMGGSSASGAGVGGGSTLGYKSLLPSAGGPPGQSGAPGPDFTKFEYTLPDKYVGLMIGKGGENITRLQAESGAKVQISTESHGTSRPAYISGTQEQVDRAKRMMDTIIQGADKPYNPNSSQQRQQPSQDSLEMTIPAAKVGLLIGRSGETIKGLQERAGVRMFLIQDTSTAALNEKPLKITGPPDRLEYARSLVMDLMNSPMSGPGAPTGPSNGSRGSYGQGAGYGRGDSYGGQGGGGYGQGGGHFGQGGPGGYGGPGSYGGAPGGFGYNQGGGGAGRHPDENYEEMKVPRRCVGVIIGKGGDMLRKISADTGAKVQFKQEGPGDRELPERILQITGNEQAVRLANEKVHHLISGVVNGEIPVTEKPRGPESKTVPYAVPADKAGLVIGKGGDTVKEINRMSGAYVSIQRDPPPNDTIKVFDIQGSQDQINEAVRLICEKAGLPPPNQPEQQEASYYTNGNQQPQAQQQQQQQSADPLPAPQYNSQTGQLDYSAAWAEYYRRQGMHDYADAILRQSQQQQPAAPVAAAQVQQPQQPAVAAQTQQDQWQQWQQWWQNSGQQQQQQPQQAWQQPQQQPQPQSWQQPQQPQQQQQQPQPQPTGW